MDVAAMLLRSKKPVVLCLNKVDSIGNTAQMSFMFFIISRWVTRLPSPSIHGLGTGSCWMQVFAYFPKQEEEDYDDETYPGGYYRKTQFRQIFYFKSYIGAEPRDCE